MNWSRGWETVAVKQLSIIKSSVLLIGLVLATMAIGCSSQPEGAIEQAPITKEMEAQAEASSNYMMEQMQTKKPAAK
jgi:hypothetical protein